MLLKIIASVIVLIVYALLPFDFGYFSRFVIILILWNAIVFLPGLFLAVFLKRKKTGGSAQDNSVRAKNRSPNSNKDKSRFAEWCEYRITDIGSKPDIKGMKPADVAKGLAHLISCDHMYQMRHNEQYWQKCINQLRDAHGDSSAATANMLFMVYDEASDEMQHTKEEKQYLKARLDQANTKFDELFWLSLDYMEESPEFPDNMLAYITKCSSL